MHYVKQWHGGTFRRVVLIGLLDSTRNLVKTQYRVDIGYTTTSGHVSSEGIRGRHTSGGGIYNVNLADTQSRDSPIGGGTYCIVNENDDNSTAHADGSTSATKHTHRKSVFKK